MPLKLGLRGSEAFRGLGGDRHGPGAALGHWKQTGKSGGRGEEREPPCAVTGPGLRERGRVGTGKGKDQQTVEKALGGLLTQLSTQNPCAPPLVLLTFPQVPPFNKGSDTHRMLKPEPGVLLLPCGLASYHLACATRAMPSLPQPLHPEDALCSPLGTFPPSFTWPAPLTL